jgi:hypothetical protein
MMSWLLMGRQPTKTQILALSKCMSAAMAQDRAAWNALSPEEQELSAEQQVAGSLNRF